MLVDPALCAVGSALATMGMSSGSAQADPPLPSTLTGTPTDLTNKLARIIDRLPGLPTITTVAPVLNSLPPVSSLPGGLQVQGLTLGDQNSVTDPAQGGSFTAPFRAPGPACKDEEEGSPAPSTVLKDFAKCPPAGVSVVVMPNGQMLYFDGLEAEENARYSIVAELAIKPSMIRAGC